VGGRLAELGDAEVALVTFTRQRNLRGYRGRLHLPFAVLTDETRSTYRAYGLGRGRWWRVWGPATVAAYARLVRRGGRTRPTGEDTLQLGGDFVIDRDGVVVYAYRSHGPADRPPVDDLVEAVRKA
jgi:peroxiredoxin